MYVRFKISSERSVKGFGRDTRLNYGHPYGRDQAFFFHMAVIPMPASKKIVAMAIMNSAA